MDLSIGALRAAYLAGERSPVEVADALLDAAAGSTAFATLDRDGALTSARAAEAAFRRGDAGPLAGIPVAVKDLVDTAGVPTGYGSSLFAGHVPDADAGLVARLRALGAVVLGKTRTHEFAWGITSEPTGHGPCRNPVDRTRVAGGSSGGSAVAVAEGLCSFAIGTDTAGSVRIPAAFCGVWGFKPTFGAISLDGVFPLAPSFDHAGVLAASAADLATAIASVHPEPLQDAERLFTAAGGGEGGGGEGRPLRVGVLSHPFEPTLHAGIAAALAGVADALTGVSVPLRLDLDDDPVADFGLVQGEEALEVHRTRGRYPARAAEYHPSIRARLDAAAARDPEEVARARGRLDHLREQLDLALATVDVALAPIHAVPPPRIGEADDLRAAVLPFTLPQSIGGVPACAVPAGRADDLPAGVQLCAPRGADARVLSVAARLGRPRA